MYDLACVTGATSGIGRAIIALLRTKKIEVIGVGSEEGDLSTSKGCARILSLIEERKPDLIINSAGIGHYGECAELSEEEQLNLIDINIRSLFRITHAGVRQLRSAHKGGVIVNISSMAGEFPTPGMSLYGASKAFVTSFSRGLNFELKKEGISVLAHCPGMVATSFASRAAKRPITPKGRFVLTPEAVAAQVWRQIVEKKECVRYPFPYRLARFLPSSFRNRWIYRSVMSRK